MPVNTHRPIASVTLSSTSGSVTFSSISQAYRDLVLVINGTISTGTGSFYLMFNNDMSANSSYNVTMEGNGTNYTSAQQGQWSAVWGPYGYNTVFSTTASTHVINVIDYSVTDKFKTILMRSSNPSTAVALVGGSWGVTSAVTSISINPTASTFAAGTTFSLYGVAA